MEEQVFDGLDPRLAAALRTLERIRNAAKQAARDLNESLFSQFDLDRNELSEGEFMALPKIAHDMWEIEHALYVVACSERTASEYLRYVRTKEEPASLRDDDLPF